MRKRPIAGITHPTYSRIYSFPLTGLRRSWNSMEIMGGVPATCKHPILPKSQRNLENPTGEGANLGENTGVMHLPVIMMMVERLRPGSSLVAAVLATTTSVAHYPRMAHRAPNGSRVRLSARPSRTRVRDSQRWRLACQAHLAGDGPGGTGGATRWRRGGIYA